MLRSGGTSIVMFAFRATVISLSREEIRVANQSTMMGDHSGSEK